MSAPALTSVDSDSLDLAMLEDAIAHQRRRRTWPAEAFELLLRAVELIEEAEPLPASWHG